MNASTSLDTALGGAQLIHLAIAKRVDIRDRQVVVIEPAPVEDSVLNDALRRVRGETKPKKAAGMIPKLTKGLRKRLLASLAEKGIVRVDERRILGFIPITRHPEADGSVEETLRQRLRDVILRNQVADERTASLAAVIQAADLESLILSRQERKASKERMKQIAAGETLTPAIASAVSAANAAAVAAIMAATAASSAASTSSSSNC